MLSSPHSQHRPASKLDSAALVSVRKPSAKPSFCDQEWVSTKQIICSALYRLLFSFVLEGFVLVCFNFGGARD